MFLHCCSLAPASGNFIQLSGAASVNTYESILRTLTYANRAVEPNPGNRTIVLEVNDGNFSSTPFLLSVQVYPQNDNNVTLNCTTGRLLEFTEAGAALHILRNTVVEDRDRDHLLSGASVQLQMTPDGGREWLSVSSQTLQQHGVSLSAGPGHLLSLTGMAVDTAYQVTGAI